MNKNTWKTIAIILTIMILLIAAWIAWGTHQYNKDMARAESCRSDICSGSQNWDYVDGVCYCLEWNTEYNSFVISHEESLKGGKVEDGKKPN